MTDREMLAERDALAQENEALRRCAIKYLGWLDIVSGPLDKALREDMANPDMCGDAAIDAALAQKGEPIMTIEHINAPETGCTPEEQAAWHAGIEAGREIERNNIAALSQPAEQRAEVEALRAEVAALQRELGALHMHAKQRDQYAVEKAVQALDWKKRAERLAEALEDIRSRSSMNLAMNPNPFELTALLGDIHQIADAMLKAREGEQ